MRPAVVVSNDRSNARINRAQVVPITSNTRRVLPTDALLVLPSGERKAMADQIRTAAFQRFGRIIARISDAEMIELEQAMRIQLGL